MSRIPPLHPTCLPCGILGEDNEKPAPLIDTEASGLQRSPHLNAVNEQLDKEILTSCSRVSEEDQGPI